MGANDTANTLTTEPALDATAAPAAPAQDTIKPKPEEAEDKAADDKPEADDKADDKAEDKAEDKVAADDKTKAEDKV